ncbi:helix-turn-helix transcriptional regulator [Paenibacillus algorifonticola]|uniref:helix-turn-helix domain-containing protein n=1 Tax=Paenibacillus algorifonticola TaxID=684063 RepID=UPI003D275907
MIQFTLDRVMRERHLSHKDIEEKTGISRNTIKALAANANTRIDFPTLDALCSKLGLLPSDLIIFTPNEENEKATESH